MNAEKWNIIDDLKQTSFIEIYEGLVSSFKRLDGFKKVTGQSCKELAWPKETGVYVVRKTQTNEVLYIGMTGSFSQQGKMNTKQRLNTRPNRWNPYRFGKTGDQKDKFLYGPDYKKHDDKNKPPSKYLNEVPIGEVEIDCFLLNGEDRLAPAFVESLLIQAFLQEKGCLPVANNKF